MSKIEVNQVDPQSGTTLTLGTSGDTVSIPSGVTLANAGTATGFPAPTSGIAASAIDSGTIATARLGSGTASSSTFLRGDQTYAEAGGGGKIGQVLQATLGTIQSTTSDGTYADITGLAQAITPVATSSKVLIIVSLAGLVNSTANGIIYFRISGGNTNSYLGTDTGGGGEQAANAWTARRSGYQQGNCNLMFLDSPSTTGAVTYQVQWQKYDGTAYINASNVDNAQSAYCMSTINCMEVLA